MPSSWEPITPPDYHGHWRQVLGKLTRVIGGSLGGPLSTLEWVGDSGFDELRRQAMEQGSSPALPEAYNKARQHAKDILGIKNKLRALFISGAGTPVWDEVLEGIVRLL